MSDFVVLRRGKSTISGGLHIVFDVVLALAILVATIASGTWVFGVALVLLSKWRMVAVRPRYWLLNAKSNLVDLTVGVGVVFLIYVSGVNVTTGVWTLSVAGIDVTFAQLMWTAVYLVWLLWVKHRTSEAMTEVQALVAVLVGLCASGLLLQTWGVVPMVVASFVIGYGAMRHVLVQSDDYDFTLLTFTSGVLMAELSWVLYHWTIILNYGWTQVRVPQVAVVGTLAMFALTKAYKSAVRHDGKIRAKEVWKPVVFSVFLMVIMILWFSEPIKNLAR